MLPTVPPHPTPALRTGTFDDSAFPPLGRNLNVLLLWPRFVSSFWWRNRIFLVDDNFIGLEAQARTGPPGVAASKGAALPGTAAAATSTL